MSGNSEIEEHFGDNCKNVFLEVIAFFYFFFLSCLYMKENKRLENFMQQSIIYFSIFVNFLETPTLKKVETKVTDIDAGFRHGPELSILELLNT